jgi:hypothetical protein
MRDWLDYSVYEFIEEVTGVKDTREQFDGEDLRRQVADLTAKQKLLLDGYLDQVIDRQTFTEKKAELMSQ